MNNHQNSVVLLGFFGGDRTHCLSAWQSTHLDFSGGFPEEISDRVPFLFHQTAPQKKMTPGELLWFLANDNPPHLTPFEKSDIYFQIRGDIATHIHQIKHRIGVSINAESARWREITDKWYIPSDWQNIPVADPGSIGFKQDLTWGQALDGHCKLSAKRYHQAVTELKRILGKKRAKETARYFLPYASQLDYDCKFNFSSFMHFQKMRNSEHAQDEIKWIAQEMLRQVKEIPGNPFELSLKAFGYS